MAIPSNTGTDPWDIVAYEAKMLFGLCRLLGNPASLQGNDLVPASLQGNDLVNNALVESACLHTRILVDILLSKDYGKGDDIRLDQLLPGLRNSTVDQLRAAYGDARTEQCPCWTLNKMIAHPSLKRGMSQDYTDVIRQLLPLIETLWQEIESHRRGIFSKLPKSIGGLDPKFCAKTSS
jgi:hypothetical protein